MELRYIGPHDAVEVPMPDGRLVVVAHNGKLEATGEHAEGLLATSQWKRWHDPQQKKDGDS